MDYKSIITCHVITHKSMVVRIFSLSLSPFLMNGLVFTLSVKKVWFGSVILSSLEIERCC